MGLSVRKVMRERWGRKQNNIQVREGITCDHTLPPCKKKNHALLQVREDINRERWRCRKHRTKTNSETGRSTEKIVSIETTVIA